MPRGTDRRIAGAAFVAFTAAVLAVTALVDSPVPKPDPFVAARLMVLAHAGDDLWYEVDYRFVRTRNGASLRSMTSVARGPGIRVEGGRDGGGTIDIGERSWSCTPIDEKLECLEIIDDTPSLGAATPFAVAALSGRYDIAEVDGRRIVERDARCFEIRLVRGAPVAGLGSELDVCIDATGVPLSTRIVGPLSTDERVATRVRTADHARLRELIASVSGGAVALDA